MIFLAIKNQKCSAYNGKVKEAKVTLTTSEEIWTNISEGNIDGQKAVLDGSMKVDGELGLLMKLDELFGQNTGAEQDSPIDKSVIDKIPNNRGPVKIHSMLWLTVTFFPWMIKWIISRFSDNYLLYLVSAALSVIIVFYHIFTNKPTLFEIGSAIYLTLASIFHVLKLDIFMQNMFFFDNLFLCGLWFSSLMYNFSLTGEYSRYLFPKQAWTTRAFLDTNKIISAYWGLYFLVFVAFSFFVMNKIGSESFWIYLRYLLLIPMFIFTSVFQRLYPKKMMNA